MTGGDGDVGSSGRRLWVELIVSRARAAQSDELPLYAHSRGLHAMNTTTRTCLLATALLVAGIGGTVNAGYCGGASYTSCAASCAAPAADYSRAVSCQTCY